MDQQSSKLTVAGKTSVLRFTGDAPIILQDVDGETLDAGFTIEAWVRPTAIERGVVLYPQERLDGSGVAFGPGRYDDLARFRSGEKGIQSLRVPPNYRAILFSDTGCSGLSLVAENDVISLGEEWDQSACSLLVLDLNGAAQSYAVVFEQPQRQGRAAVLNFRRYEALTFLPVGQSSFSSIYVPPGLEVTLYDRPRCQGESFTVRNGFINVHERIAQIDGWTGEVRSLALTRSTDGPAAQPSGEVRYAQIFEAESGDGLSLEIAPSSSPVRPPEIRFAKTTVRADRWQHIARTYDGAHLVSFVNGRAVDTRMLEDAPALAGAWHMGDGFYGEIGMISVRAGARSPHTLRAKRFDLPPPEGIDDADPDDGTILHRAWLFKPQDTDGASISELKTGTTADIPADEAFWVAAQLPRSLLASGIGRKALSQAQQRSNEAQQQARLEGQATLDRARKKARQQKRDADIRAQSQANVARIERIHTICGGEVMQFGANGNEAQSDNNFIFYVWIDVAANSATKFVYLAGRLKADPEKHSLWRVGGSETGSTPKVIAERYKPIHALTTDSERNSLYWIEGDGELTGLHVETGADPVSLQPALIPGRAGEWHMAFDPRQQRLLWSNGREIWGVTLSDDNKLQYLHVVVSHGRSPHPLALTVDDETGDIYWLDKELEMVRTCDSDGNNIRDLYEALDPREGIALDYFDLSKLPTDEPAHPAVTVKRLYWNAEYRQMVEAAVIDDPGLFCWLQHLEGQARPQNNIDALEDVHLFGSKWCEWDGPQIEKNEKFDLFFYTPDNKLHALGTWSGNAIIELDVTTGNYNNLVEWNEDQQGPLPLIFATDETGSKFIGSNRYGGAMGIFGAPVFDSTSGIERVGHWSHGASFRQPPGIQEAAFSVDGKLAVLALSSFIIEVWDLTTDARLRNLEGHNNEIRCLLTYAIGDKQYALSGSNDNTINNWDLATGICLQTLKGHAKSIAGIDITKDRKRVVSASYDDTLKVWDLASGACLQTLKGHTSKIESVTIHPDGRRVISASADKTIKVWDIVTGVCLRTLEGHEDTVLRAAVTNEGRQLISTGDDNRTLRWDLDRHLWVLGFDGDGGYVDLGPLFLKCEQGFSVELQIRLEVLENEMTVFNLGNGSDGDNISLLVDGGGNLAFAVEDHGKMTRMESNGNETLSAGEWYTVSLAVDSVGRGIIHVDGRSAGEGQVTLPRTCLRLQNVIGRSTLHETANLHGKIGMLRLWNRALTLDEIDNFHKEPTAAPKSPQPIYHRSMMEYRNGRPYLMSGMSDGSTPASAVFELALDKGLVIESKSTSAHARLLTAQHDKEVDDRNAVADRARAQQAAREKVSAAHAQNKAAHAHAQDMLDMATADAAKKRVDNQQRLAAASQSAQQKIADAQTDARQQRAVADEHARQIKDDAQRKAEKIQRDANRALSDALAEKAKYE